MGEESNQTIPSVSDLESRSPGEDLENPYEETDTSELPDWWQKAIDIHQKYDLRPYQPPRFDDGTLKHAVVETIEETYDVDIDFIDLDITDDVWQIRVDGTIIGKISRHRSTEGYTVFEMESDEFEEYVRRRIDD